MTILILEIRCNVYVLQQLFRVPKIVTFLLLVIAPSSSSPYILYAFALLQGTRAGFHVRMGAFCHVQELLAACCRPPPCFLPLCSHKISSMYGVRIPLNIIFHIFGGNHRLELAKSAFRVVWVGLGVRGTALYKTSRPASAHGQQSAHCQGRPVGQS